MRRLVSVLFVFTVLGSSCTEKTNLNMKVDSILNHSNKAKENHRMLKISTTGEITMLGSGTVDEAEGMLLGMDSLVRTGDCFKVDGGNKKSFNIQFGLRLMVLALQRVSIRGIPMSAFFRVKDNSLNFTYTVYEEPACLVKIDVLRVDRLQDVLFGSSRTDFDGTDVNYMFQNGIRAWLNRWLDKLRPEIEKRLQFRCMIPLIKEELPSALVTDTFKSLLEDVAIL